MSSFAEEQKRIAEKFANHGVHGLALEMGNDIMKNFEAFLKQNRANCDSFQILKNEQFFKLFVTYIHHQ
jgi:hypothetical protein